MYGIETEFEKRFPKCFVNSVRASFLKKTHGIKIRDVVKVCKRYKVTYSDYQQMESLFLAKLQRIV